MAKHRAPLTQRDAMRELAARLDLPTNVTDAANALYRPEVTRGRHAAPMTPARAADLMASYRDLASEAR